MKRSTCASGSGYVPSVSIGFCVAITRKGAGTLCVSPAIVTWRSCITSSSALCTLAGARLISSASSRFAKTGPSTVENSPDFWLYMRVPTRSAGSRSGVNWMRLNVPRIVFASVLTVSVFARPGTPSTSRWPWARIATSTRSRKWSCPTTTRLTSYSTRCISSPVLRAVFCSSMAILA